MVTIAFTDATRSSPDRQLVGGLLAMLERDGVRRDDVTLLCATGLHRPSTDAERRAKLGDAIVDTVRIVDHDATDPSALADLGEVEGIPIVVNRRCVECDRLYATGVVEPHQYAGYSGGAKTVVIGCGGEATIAATHGPAMIDREGVRLGAIDGNPFQRFVRAAGERIGITGVANVVIDAGGELLASASGPVADVHDRLVATARDAFTLHVDRAAHVVVAGVPAAKAANLYQASRAATYVALAERTPLLPGAPIVLDAAIPEGAGAGLGERRFFELLSGAVSPSQLVADLRRTGFPGGAQRAYVLASVLASHPIIVAGALHPDIVRACHMIPAASLDDGRAIALTLARTTFGVEPHLLEIPNALITLPMLSRG